jgi:hypothetical protein
VSEGGLTLENSDGQISAEMVVLATAPYRRSPASTRSSPMLLSAPPFLQRLVMPPLARVGKRRGYRAGFLRRAFPPEHGGQQGRVSAPGH